MVLEFKPPTDLVNAYLNRPSPGQVASEAVNQALQTYAQSKALQQQQALAQESKDIEMAKGIAGNGQDFLDSYNKIVAARTTPKQTAQGSSLIDRAKAFFSGPSASPSPTASPLTPNPDTTGMQSTGQPPAMSVPPPVPSTGTASGFPPSMPQGVQKPITPMTDPSAQEYMADPIAFKKAHGTQGIDKLKTQVEIDSKIGKPEDKYYTTDQATKLLKNNPEAKDAISSFEKDRVPRDAVHLLMQQNRSNESKDSQIYVGNAEDGSPVNKDKHGNFFVNGQPYKGKILSKTSETPTATTRSSSEFAKTVIPHIQSMRDLIKQADEKGYIGPAAGRVYNQFMAGSVGSTGNPDADKLLGRLRATDSLLKTGAMKAHFGSRGGQQMYEHFSDLLNSGKQSAAMMNGSLDTLESFMQGYADAGVNHNAPAVEDGWSYTPGPGGKGNQANWTKVKAGPR